MDMSSSNGRNADKLRNNSQAKRDSKKHNWLQAQYQKVKHRDLWSEVKADLRNNALVKRDRSGEFQQRIEQKNYDAEIKSSREILDNYIQSIAEDIKTQSRCEKQIAYARINELTQDFKIREANNKEQPGINILKAKAKKLTYRILQCSVGALDVSKRKGINSKLAQYTKRKAKFIDNSPASPSEGNQTAGDYLTRKFEMPSFSHLTLDDLKTFAKNSRSTANDESPVTMDEIKKAGKELKQDIQTLLKYREMEQGISALSIAFEIKQANSDKARQEIQKIREQHQDVINEFHTIGENQAFSTLMGKLQEQQFQKGEQLGEAPQWADFTKPFEYAYRRKTGVGKPLDMVAHSIKNHKYLKIFEHRVKTRTRTALFLATLPVTVPLSVGVGLSICAAYIYGKEIGNFTKRQALNAYNKIELGKLHRQEKHHTMEQERLNNIKDLQDKLSGLTQTRQAYLNTKNDILQIKKEILKEEKKSLKNDSNVKTGKTIPPDLVQKNRILKQEKDRLYRECKQLLRELILRRIGLKSRAKMPEKPREPVVENRGQLAHSIWSTGQRKKQPTTISPHSETSSEEKQATMPRKKGLNSGNSSTGEISEDNTDDREVESKLSVEEETNANEQKKIKKFKTLSRKAYSALESAWKTLMDRRSSGSRKINKVRHASDRLDSSVLVQGQHCQAESSTFDTKEINKARKLEKKINKAREELEKKDIASLADAFSKMANYIGTDEYNSKCHEIANHVGTYDSKNLSTESILTNDPNKLPHQVVMAKYDMLSNEIRKKIEPQIEQELKVFPLQELISEREKYVYYMNHSGTTNNHNNDTSALDYLVPVKILNAPFEKLPVFALEAKRNALQSELLRRQILRMRQEETMNPVGQDNHDMINAGEQSHLEAERIFRSILQDEMKNHENVDNKQINELIQNIEREIQEQNGNSDSNNTEKNLHGFQWCNKNGRYKLTDALEDVGLEKFNNEVLRTVLNALRQEAQKRFSSRLQDEIKNHEHINDERIESLKLEVEREIRERNNNSDSNTTKEKLSGFSWFNSPEASYATLMNHLECQSLHQFDTEVLNTALNALKQEAQNRVPEAQQAPHELPESEVHDNSRANMHEAVHATEGNNNEQYIDVSDFFIKP